MSQKKLRVGDVVVITSPIGLENRYGWLGLIEHVIRYSDPHRTQYGVRFSNEMQGFIDEYFEESLEIIDHIDEEEEMPQVCVGDVVVIKWPYMEGELGLVTGLLDPGACEVKTEMHLSRFLFNELEVIDHIDETKEDDDADDAWPEDEEQRPGDQADDPTPSKFKVGDRVKYTGKKTPEFIGRTGTVREAWPLGTLLIVWDNIGTESTVDPNNVTLLHEKPATEEYVFGDVKMHFDGRSPLVCFDCSGSMDLDNLKEQWCQYEKTVRASTHLWGGYVFGTSSPHAVFLDQLSLASEWGQGQSTDLKPVLNYAALHGLTALLIFSDGNMDLNELNKYPQLRTVIITPKNEMKFYKGKTLVGQGTITPPKTYAYNGIIEQKAEEALKDVQRQEDLNAFGITEHPIRGTQRTLRLEYGSTVAKVICKSCNTVLKEIDLTK